ncbi:MAG: tetratricopeptide repeat protein, partial [Candidatus Marinimicrobia bacterium]|nr:tetratricopeptide repeat protein [Candidatus Neomarinimicrobiota bacterium]
EAYRLYLKGRYYWNKRTEEGQKKCIECLEKAIKQDPLYALAYAGLADAYIILGDYNYLLQEEAYSKAKNAAVKALKIDDTLAQAHTSLGCVKSIYDWDWEEAEREFKQAIKLNPKYETAYHWYSINYLIPNSRFEEAIVNIKRAQDLDPLSLIINTTVGLVFYYARHYEQAIEQYKKTLEMDPNFGVAYFFLGWAYEQKAMFEEAISALQKAVTLSGDSTAMIAELGCTYAGAGKKTKAIKILGKFKKPTELNRISSYSIYSIAAIYAGLGNKNQAIEWLQRAYSKRSYRLIYLQVDPKFDTLRSDHRFKTLLKKVGLKK